MPFLRPELFGSPVLGLLLTWSGAIAEGMRAIAPLRAIGSPVGDLVRPVPYRAIQTLLDGSATHGTHSYWKSHRLLDLSDAVIDRIVGLVESATSPVSMVSGWAIGGAVGRVDPRATAVGEREVGFELRVIGVWPPGDTRGESHTAWVRQGWDSLRPDSNGRQYATFLSDEGFAGVQAAYGDHLARLVALKDRYDPTNVFRLNVNIPPSHSENGETR